MLSPVEKRPRFAEHTKWLPVAFVSCIILGLYLIYVCFHCVPLLQLGVPVERQDGEARQRGLIEFVVFHTTTFFLVVCYFRSIWVHPGEIPNDPRWERDPQDQAAVDKGDHGTAVAQETKRSGDRRYCKWCGKYKPDRCHHCRVCRCCILKMDHHCPWIYNCVGFGNHKYFFLLLFYTLCTTQIIMWTMIESVMASVETDTPFLTMFMLLFGETLAWFLGILIFAFFGFHIWLVMKSMTTIEFCEKSLKKGGSYDMSPYDQGPYRNITSVLGRNPILWLLPTNPHEAGDCGTKFLPSEQTPLMHRSKAMDLEDSRGRKKMGHSRQKLQQSRRAPSDEDDSILSDPSVGLGAGGRHGHH